MTVLHHLQHIHDHHVQFTSVGKPEHMYTCHSCTWTIT